MAAFVPPSKLIEEEQLLVRQCANWLDDQHLPYVKNYKIEPRRHKQTGKVVWTRTLEQGTPNLVIFLPGRVLVVRAIAGGYNSKHWEWWQQRVRESEVETALARSLDGFIALVSGHLRPGSTAELREKHGL